MGMNKYFNTSKCETTFDKDGFGFAPGYEKKFEGVEVDRIRLDKNLARFHGLCKNCDKHTGKKGTNGEHCDQPVNESCIF